MQLNTFKDEKDCIQQINDGVQPSESIQNYMPTSDHEDTDPENQRILLESKRFYKKNKWALSMIETCLETNLQSSTIELHYGRYAMKISVINLMHKYDLQLDQNHIGSGNFGSVFACKFNGTCCAVKMIKFEHEDFLLNLKSVYQEYFIAALASQLKVGPQIIDLFGYQIVFLKNFGLFGMELCGKLTFKDRSKQQKVSLISSLRKSLKIFHSLHVVHRDIKPNNIVWSFNYQKFVFIDFGLSLIVKQAVGQKTITAFSGSFAYCSPEMRKCFFLQSQIEVDLYQNDIHAFQICEKIFFSKEFLSITTQSYQQIQEQDSFIHSLSCITRVKCAIYQNEYEMAQFYLIKNQNLIKSCHHILHDLTSDNSLLPEDFFKKFINLKQKLKKKIIFKKFRISQHDEIIFNALSTFNISQFYPYLLLSDNYLEKFNEWIHNQKLLTKIFFYLNSFDLGNPLLEQQIQKWREKVKKIYKALKLSPTELFIKKVRSVLLFFFQNYKKFNKKTQMLYYLSGYFNQIGDRSSALKVKDFILKLTEDPIEYFLRALKYKLIDFPYKNNFHDFLKFNQQKLSKIKQNSGSYKIVGLILKIFQIIDIIQRKKKKDFENLFKIKRFLEELRLLISQEKNESIQIFERIWIRFNFQYEQRSLYKIESENTEDSLHDVCQINFKHIPSSTNLYLDQKSNSARQHQIQSLCEERRLNEMQSSSGQRCMKNIHSFIYYGDTYQKLISQFCSEETHLSKKQDELFLFYFEMSEGYVLNFTPLFFFTPMKLIRHQKSITLMVQRFQTDWVQNKEKIGLKNFGEFFQQIQWNVRNLFEVLASKDLGLWRQKFHESQYFLHLGIFFEIITENIESILTDQIQKQRLYLTIRIAALARKCYSFSKISQQIIEGIDNIYEQVKKQNIIQNDEEYSIYFVFLNLLTAIFQTNLTMDPLSQEHLENIFLQAYNDANDLDLLIKIPNSLKIIVEIIAKKKKHKQNIKLIQQVIIYAQSKQEEGQNFPFLFMNILIGSLTFRQRTPEPIANEFVHKIFSKEQRENLKKLLTKPQGCMFLFNLVFTIQNQINFIKKCFFKIGSSFSTMIFYLKNELISKYLRFLINYATLRKRKKFLVLRQLQRLSIIIGDINPVEQLKKIIQAKSLKWINKIQNKIRKKFPIFFK